MNLRTHAGRPEKIGFHETGLMNGEKVALSEAKGEVMDVPSNSRRFILKS